MHLTVKAKVFKPLGACH